MNHCNSSRLIAFIIILQSIIQPSTLAFLKSTFFLNPGIMQFPKKWKEDYRYKSDDRILVLGEMDFSLSLAIYSKIPTCTMISTAYYQSVEHIPSRCRSAAKGNINKLKAMGCHIRFNIDAETIRSSEKVDKVIFTFPRTRVRKKVGDHLQIPFIERIMNKLGTSISLRSDLHSLIIII